MTKASELVFELFREQIQRKHAPGLSKSEKTALVTHFIIPSLVHYYNYTSASRVPFSSLSIFSL